MTIEIKCKTCSKIVIASPSRGSRKKYCSKECLYKRFEKTNREVCINCQTVFLRRPCERKKKKTPFNYCTYPCFLRAQEVGIGLTNTTMKICGNGQLNIPAKIIRQTRFKPGTVVDFIYKNTNEITIKILEPEIKVSRGRKFFNKKGKTE